MDSTTRRISGLIACLAVAAAWVACDRGVLPLVAPEGPEPLEPAADGDIEADRSLDLDGVWSPSGKWGADGDMGGGGYKGEGWSCLICGDPATERPAAVEVAEMAMRLVEEGRGGDGRVPYTDPEPEELYVSADDSNSQSSATLVRGRIQGGDYVQAYLLRMWEFLNYYEFDYEEPAGGKAIRVTPQLRPYDASEGIYALQIGVQGKHVDAVRRQLNVTFCVDTSGSMAGTPLSLAQESMRAIAAHLRAGDRVSMVSWSTVQNVPLDSVIVAGPDDPAVLAAIGALAADGSTDLQSGLIAAYALANENFIEGAMNRVVLLSDGGANVGITDADLIAEEAAGGEAEAVYLVGVGVGTPSTYNDTLMDTVTDLGKGAAVFVDSVEEAHRAFEDRFLANLEMIAHDVQIRLTLPPGFAMYEFLGEEYSEDPDEVEPQNLGPNDAMVVQQLIKTDEPDDVGALDELGVKVTWTDAFTGLADEEEGVWTLQALVDAEADELRKGDAIVVFVQTLGRIAEAISLGYETDTDTIAVECAWAAAVLDEAFEALGDPEIAEIAALLDGYCAGLVGG